MEPRQKARATELLLGVRAEAAKFNLNQPVPVSTGGSRISDEEAHVLDILQSAGVQFAYPETIRNKMVRLLPAVAFGLAASISEKHRVAIGVAGSLVTTLAVLVQSKGGPTAELWWRLRYKRDTIWDVLQEKPQLTRAIHEAIREWHIGIVTAA